MRTVIQRVSSAAVEVDGRRIAAIERGLLVLAAFAATDTDDTLDWIARKITSLRVFEDDEGRMNRTLEEIGGAVLVVSQFTLYGDCRKGRRPSFERSAPPGPARVLYEAFIRRMREHSAVPVESGVFQEHMCVSLVNDGPVTLIVEKDEP